MVKIHHLQYSQSERIVWLCEELGVPYELQLYQRSPIFSPPEYLALHPLGAAPVIEDGNIKIAESEACAEYIINVHGSGKFLVGSKEPNYADFLYWYHFANGTLQPHIGRPMYLKFGGVPADNQALLGAEARVDRALTYLNDRLGQVRYLAGDQFTLADVMPIFTLTTMRVFSPYDLSKYSNILSYLERITSRPAYRKAMKKGDPEINIESQIKGPPPPRFAALANRG